MSLKDKITTDMKEALKGGEQGKLKLSTLRLLLSEIKNGEIAKKKELSDEEIVGVVSKEIKKRKEAVEQYQKGNRPELAAKEKKEAKILQEYLPEQLSDDELKTIIQETIEEMGVSGLGEMGKVMGAVMSKVKGRAEGSRVSEVVKGFLA